MSHWQARGLMILILMIIITAGILPLVTAQQSDVTIGSINVTPTNPSSGDAVVINAELRNSETSTGSVKISQVSIDGPSIDENADDIGKLGPGTSVTVPFSVVFDEPGQKKLTVTMYGQEDTGSVFSIQKPVYVSVERDSTLLSSTTETVAAGGLAPINITVSNGDNEAITGVQLTVDDVRVEEPQRTRGSIASGSEQTFQYDAYFESPGQHSLTSTIIYQTSDGVTHRTTETIPITVERPRVNVDLSVRANSNQSGGTVVELTNFGNTYLSDITVNAAANGDIVARKLLSNLQSETSRSLTFEPESGVSGPLEFTARYEAAGKTHSVSATTNQALGEIRLTSVETTQGGTAVTITGDAANIGRTNADGVLLSIADTSSTTPVSPSGEYFVGEIEASEFATFELTASVQPDINTIPVNVGYVVEGDRIQQTQRIPLSVDRINASTEAQDAAAVAQQSNDRSDDRTGSAGLLGSLPLLPIGAVVMILVIAIGTYRWRRVTQ
ncbi:hypothetical protein [Haloquadratum walsbyi]|jgi:hypothetical protein|uniref:hypothetical protein n=1 Tax=Haloquadratum walsbyi TaxID=293091 RepID=UPI0023EFC2AF|nr:hypothetical protein [Haloquadratum walsbyi]